MAASMDVGASISVMPASRQRALHPCALGLVGITAETHGAERARGDGGIGVADETVFIEVMRML